MTPAPAPKSEAHRRIAQLVVQKGPACVEKQLDLGEGTVRAWIRAGRVPQKRIRELVAARLGVAEELWAAPAGAVAPSPHPVSTLTQRPSNGAEKGDTTSPASPTDPSDARENVVATLRVLRARLEQLSVAGAEADVPAVARIATAVVTATCLLARISGQLDVTEAQILRSDAWRKLVGIVRDVLKDFPGAPEALDKRMAEYEARA